MCLSARIKKVAAEREISPNNATRLDQRQPIQQRRANGRLPLLRDANMSGAKLVGTNLCGVDLRFVKGLTREQLGQAIVDEQTQIPDYLTEGAVHYGNNQI